MPGGAAAVRGVKELSPATRILALSVSRDRAAVIEMLEAGADGAEALARFECEPHQPPDRRFAET